MIRLLLVALLAPGAPVDHAKNLYEAGSRAYEQGQYVVAIRAFEEAHRLAAHPAVLFSLAQSYRLQYFVDGDAAKLARAAELYRAYIAAVPKGGRRDHAAQHLSTIEPMLQRAAASPTEAAPEAQPAQLIVASATVGATARVDGGEAEAIPAAFEVAPGPHRVLVEAPAFQPKTVEAVAVTGRAIALNVDLDAQPGRLSVVAPEGASIAVDGRVLGVGPLPEPLDLPAGRHLVAITDRGRAPFLQQIDIGRGEQVEVAAELDLSGQRIAAWTFFGASAAVALGAGRAGWQALEHQADAQDLESQLDDGGFSVAEANRYNDMESQRDDATELALGLGVAATGLALTGLVLWIFDSPDPVGAPVLTPTAAPGRAVGLR